MRQGKESTATVLPRRLSPFALHQNSRKSRSGGLGLPWRCEHAACPHKVNVSPEGRRRRRRRPPARHRRAAFPSAPRSCGKVQSVPVIRLDFFNALVLINSIKQMEKSAKSATELPIARRPKARRQMFTSPRMSISSLFPRGGGRASPGSDEVVGEATMMLSYPHDVKPRCDPDEDSIANLDDDDDTKLSAWHQLFHFASFWGDKIGESD